MNRKMMRGKLSLTRRQGRQSTVVLVQQPLTPDRQISTVCAGLNNLGNTCYCNAVLQALRHCPGFSTTLKIQGSISHDRPMVQILNELIHELEKSASPVAPLSFLQSLRRNGQFTEGVQHDAQELLISLLADSLAGSPREGHSCPQRVGEGHWSDPAVGSYGLQSVTALFQGQLAFQTRCLDCEHCTSHSQPFLHVSVPVTSPVPAGFPHTQQSCGSSAAAVSLSWCLSRFLSQERLSEDNKFWCDNCLHLVEAERSILFACLPNVFTIHLNRFSVQEWGSTVDKVASNVAIPMTLCMRRWSTQDSRTRGTVYILQAVVLHTGASCSSGHYTTMVREDKQWLHFDDEKVVVLPETAVQELLSPLPLSPASPYVLFYHRLYT